MINLCSVIMLLLIIIFVIYLLSKNNFKNITKSIEDVYRHIKTGDLLVIFNKQNKPVSLRVAYRDIEHKHVGYVVVKNNTLHLESINRLLNPNHEIVMYKLKEKRSYDILEKFSQYIKKAYIPFVSSKMNLVLYYNRHKIFIMCEYFIIELLLALNLIHFTNPVCINDPLQCIQQSYQNSAFLSQELYSDKIITII